MTIRLFYIEKRDQTSRAVYVVMADDHLGIVGAATNYRPWLCMMFTGQQQPIMYLSHT